METLTGKRVLVTGGARGIGRAISLAFARGGASVLACYHRSAEAAERLAVELKELPGDHEVARADVTDRVQAQALADLARERFGGLDVLVNNVGTDGSTPFTDLTDDAWDRSFALNVTSAFRMSQASLSVLADGGSIVNIGAAAALRGRAPGVDYSASKAALVGFTRALCKELGPRGIRVNLVAPGPTISEPGGGPPPAIAQRIARLAALGRLGRAEDVAAAVLFLAGDTAAHITGETITVDGGI